MTAFYHLALDTGARCAELCGLLWQDVDLKRGQIAIVRQLIKPGAPPQFGPPKNGTPCTITLTPKTVDLFEADETEPPRAPDVREVANYVQRWITASLDSRNSPSVSDWYAKFTNV